MRLLDRMENTLWKILFVLLALVVTGLLGATRGAAQQLLGTDAPKTSSSADAIYKLVYAREYDGKAISVGNKEFDEHRRAILQDFTSQLNEAGRHNYRAISMSANPVAIVRLDEEQYEYEWFDTTSPVHFAKAGLGAKLEELGKAGLRVIEHFPIRQTCNPIQLEEPAYGDTCEYKDLFIAERPNKSKKSVEQVVIGISPGWGATPSEPLTAEIAERLAEGFYPVRALSQFEILLERVKQQDDIPKVKPDVRIVRSGWGTDNVKTKVNELAERGYRIAVVANDIAVMYRNSDTPRVPVRYRWVRADKKDFLKELEKLQKDRIRYHAAYPNEKGTRNTLIFEQNLDGKGQQSEFKLLTFEFNSVESLIGPKVYRDLTPGSKEAVKTMNKLAGEGFVVRDLFYTGKVSVIMERIRPIV